MRMLARVMRERRSSGSRPSGSGRSSRSKAAPPPMGLVIVGPVWHVARVRRFEPPRIVATGEEVSAATQGLAALELAPHLVASACFAYEPVDGAYTDVFNATLHERVESIDRLWAQVDDRQDALVAYLLGTPVPKGTPIGLSDLERSKLKAAEDEITAMYLELIDVITDLNIIADDMLPFAPVDMQIDTDGDG